MSITYTLRRRDSRSLTTTGSGVTFTVAVGPRGPSIVDDATALGALTDASADAPFLLAANAAGTFARKVTLGSVARSFMGATTQAAGRTAIDAEQAGTATSAIAAHLAAVNPHTQYALESSLGTVATINLPGGTTVFLRGDGTWAAAGGGSITSTDITDSTVVGRAVLTAADAAAARSAIGAGTGSGDATTSGTLGQFAATTSAQLRDVLSDETGSGAAVFAGDPDLTGTVSVYQTGQSGASTKRADVYHDGTRTEIYSRDGGIRLRDPFDSVTISQGIVTTTGIVASKFGSYGFGVEISDTVSLSFTSALGFGSGDVAFRRNSAGVMEIDNRTAGTYRDLILRNLTASAGTITLGTFTVGTLPSAAANTGAVARVSDSNVAASGNYGATVAGGGANVVKVFSNGSNWIIA